MKNRILLVAGIILFSTATAFTQNFSGLQYKKLNPVVDLGSALESLLGRLGGSIDGEIDSVVVLFESERELKLNLYYQGYQDGFFNLSTMGGAREREPGISSFKFSQTSSGSPVECVLKLDPKLTTAAAFQSPYLRIDISKKENRPGKVKVFDLRKKWKTDVAAENVIMNVALQPVGVAGTLNMTTPGDVVPSKRLIFDNNATFHKSLDNRRIRTIKTTGNSFQQYVTIPYDDISGTWTNIDANTTGLSKLIVNNNSTVQVFKRCSPQDCDLGVFTLSNHGGENYSAKVLVNVTKTDLKLSLVNNELQVKHTQTMTFGVNKTTTYTFKKNLMLFMQPKIYSFDEAILVNWGKPPLTPVSTVAQGPGSARMLNLWNNIAVDPNVDFQRPQDISNININVVGDKNQYSGIYYILPADYHLKWEEKLSPEEGYDFLMTYGKGTSEVDAEAPVRMSATLTAGINNRERALVKAMLKAIDANFKDIQYLPLREPPQSTFPSTLNAQFGVPTERINVTSTTDLSNDIKVAWRTNPDTKEFIQTALTSREGISATIILKPKNEELLDHLVPATINLADTRSLGKMSIEPIAWRSKNWRNTTPYPLQLRYLHVMKKATTGNTLIIYSWSMNDMEVPSRAQVGFDHSKVPTWLDNDPTAVMWIEYGVLDCTECDTKVLNAVTDGVFGGTSQQVKFTIAPAVFDTLNADYFMITLRSKQADPKNEIVKELEALKIIKDPSKDYSTGPLYLTPGTTPDFEYQIVVATKDGEFYRSSQWIKANEKDILLGNKAMKEIFKGIVPGIQ